MEIEFLNGSDRYAEKYIPYLNRKNRNNYFEYFLNIKKTDAKGKYIDFFFNGIYICYGNFSFERKARIKFENTDETIKMHFVLNGNSMIKSVKPLFLHHFQTNEHNLIYSSKAKKNWEWKSDNQLELFEINLTVDFLKKYIPNQETEIKQFLNAIKNQNTCCLFNQNFTITSDMSIIIKEIIHCKREGDYKKMHLEAKVIELLLLQFEQLCCNKCPLKKPESDKMHVAKALILANIKNPLSLKELAHQVGTNEFTLKKDFKTIFGTTVFGYLSDFKMEKALKLLTEDRQTVTQVAEIIGYKNATHFTAAFKKKYGILPSALKK